MWNKIKQWYKKQQFISCVRNNPEQFIDYIIKQMYE